MEREKAKISICMMGRNVPWNKHEDRLPNALASVKDLAYEIIFVDTTLPTDPPNKLSEIAESFGAKVYKHPWIDNYSFHRNQSIQYATGDWVLVIDCDAELKWEKKDLDNILYDFTQFKKKIHAVAFPTEDIQHGRVALKFNPARCFRRVFTKNGKKHSGIHYVRRVHNAPIFKGEVAFYPYMKVEHFGYQMTGEQKRLKHNYMIDLLHKALQDDSKDYVCYFYLNQCHSLVGELEISIKYGEEYLKYEKNSSRFNSSVYFTLFRAYKSLGDINKAANMVREGIEKTPDDMDLNLAMVELGISTNKIQLVEKGGEGYIRTWNGMNSSDEAGCVQNRFLLSGNTSAVSFILENLSAAKLQQGIVYLRDLYNHVQVLDKEARKEVLREIDLVLDTIGVSELKNIFHPIMKDAM